MRRRGRGAARSSSNEIVAVSAAQLEAVAGEEQNYRGDVPKEAGSVKFNGSLEDLIDSLSGAGLEPATPKSVEAGHLIPCKCWAEEHASPRPAYAMLRGNGLLSAKCLSDKCSATLSGLLKKLGMRVEDVFAANPDEVVDKINALGVTVMFMKRGHSYVVADPGAKRMLHMKVEGLREYIASRAPSEDEHPYTVWSRSPRRREAFRFEYAPERGFGDIQGGSLNLWGGMAYEPGSSRQGAKLLKSWRKHLLDHICSGREDLALYLWRLFAWKVQNPTWLPMVMPLAIGTPGDGKGIGFLPVVNLFGEHGLHTESSLLGRQFNDLLEGRAVVFHDEAEHLSDPRVMRALKAQVTESRGTYETKGVPMYQGDAFALHLAATNNERVRIEQSDRRLLVLHTTTPKGGIEWFERMGIRELVAKVHLARPDSIAFHRQLLLELRAEDVAGWRPNPAPDTSERGELILQSPDLSVLRRFVIERLSEGRLVGQLPWPEKASTLTVSQAHDLFAEYRAWISAYHARERELQGVPGREYSGFAKGALAFVGGSSKVVKVTGRAQRQWMLPGLVDAREEALRQLGIGKGVDWDDPTQIG